MAARRVAIAVAAGVLSSAVATVVTAAASEHESPSVHPHKTIPTVPTDPDQAPPSSEPGVAGSGVPATGAPPDSSLTTELRSDGLRPDAQLPEFVALAGALLHDTDDVAAELNRVVPLRHALPSPIHSDLSTVSVTYDSESGTFDAIAEFNSPASPADLVAFYQAMLVGTGYAPTRAPLSSIEASGTDVTSLAYAADSDSNSGPDAGTLSVEIRPNGDAGAVRLVIADVLDPEVLSSFTSWAPRLPLVDDGATPKRALVRFQKDESGRPVVTLESTFLFTAITPDELAQRFTDAVATSSGLYAIEPPESGSSVDVSVDEDLVKVVLIPRTPVFRGLHVAFEPDGADCRLTVSGHL